MLNGAALLVDGEQISSVVAASDIPTGYQTIDLGKGVLAPGFIDWQVNGGGGVLFNNDISADAIMTIAKGHHQGGTTSLMPTLISDHPDTLPAAVSAIKTARSKSCVASNSILGLHIEGPFFCHERRGTHDAQSLRRLSDSDVDWFCSIEALNVVLTLAPEATEAGQIKRLSESGIIVSAGHTNATSAEIQAALEQGLRGFTHLYNAMSQLTSRAPGVVGAALADQNSWCGMIVDGHHVDPISARVAIEAKPQGKMCLVTDAMATVGSEMTSFELYGMRIAEQDGRLINSEGNLAGSAISMIEAVKICHQQVGVSLEECLRMASLYPAHFLGVESTLGKLQAAYRADMVHFDEDLRITQTWVAGEAML